LRRRGYVLPNRSTLPADSRLRKEPRLGAEVAAMAKFAIAMLVSADLPRSRDFYRDVFGLEVSIDSPEWVDFDLGGGVSLGLHPPSDYLQLLPGSLSIGFEVPDVDAFIDDAVAKGVQIAMQPSDESFGRLAVVVDPDGYSVQVYTPTKRG
jgi:predicted enzyme related to lactoylglutathione lyase